ncbi:zinc metallopeptidase [Motiliproteus sp. SC1-56]|uniref:zinc metallopeptidase n=1 Tax=Motiliproteus sp. SC1-56 TaxID=2799565 RepID=UPI001A8CB7E9|nr:zinc metallopeptidase [Motiliproteus sp. SC1-56]
MDAFLFGLTVILTLASPKIWARYVFYKHSCKRQDLPGTGGDLARLLTRCLPLNRVSLKQAENRSHYDLETSSLNLSAYTMNSRSLTAVVRAAYEVGHAVQHQHNGDMARFREGLLTLARFGEKLGSGAFLVAPLMAIVLPPAAGLLLFVALVSMLTGAVIHLVLLPMEWQASFHLARPLLAESRYVPHQESGAVRQLLLACAFSQLAYALANLLDGRHWLKVLGLRQERSGQPECK